MNSSQSFIDIGTIILAVVVIAGAFWWIYRQAQIRVKAIESLGFRRWTEVDARFVRAVRSLVLHRRHQHLEIKQAFRRILPDSQMVLFDIVDNQASGTDIRRNLLAVVTPDADLPEFRIFPQSALLGPNRHGNLRMSDTNRMVDMAQVEFGERLVEFVDQPEIARRFTVTTQDVERASSFLTAERLQRLSSLPIDIYLQVGGELILIDRIYFVSVKQPYLDPLPEIVDLANQVAQILLH